MPRYDASHYDPPAPFTQVILRDMRDAASHREATLLIDTGADSTLLPAHDVNELGISPVSGVDYELLGFDGARSSAEAVELDMVFLRKVYRDRHLLISADYGILGRDVLASLTLLMDGPRQEWAQHQRNSDQ